MRTPPSMALFRKSSAFSTPSGGRGSTSSKSNRASCCPPQISRVFTRVGVRRGQSRGSILKDCTCPLTFWPKASSPTMPASQTRHPIPRRFAATFPAPPRLSAAARVSHTTTGMGASRDTRRVDPVR